MGAFVFEGAVEAVAALLAVTLEEAEGVACTEGAVAGDCVPPSGGEEVALPVGGAPLTVAPSEGSGVTVPRAEGVGCAEKEADIVAMGVVPRLLLAAAEGVPPPATVADPCTEAVGCAAEADGEGEGRVLSVGCAEALSLCCTEALLVTPPPPPAPPLCVA